MKNKRLIFIIGVGLMAALVFVGNYLQVKIPNGVLVTRIHFGNSMCLLAGLIFGPIGGGLASGIGAALYDLIDPVYIISAPFTFLSKFAMGFVCGALASRYKGEKKSGARRDSERRFGTDYIHSILSLKDLFRSDTAWSGSRYGSNRNGDKRSYLHH